ncbi:hypothetical protein BGZ95_001927 [Linnemannia exigua]|uniref:Transmembrane protein n=1 Tax=Linnemannia exigua TaxID=604196 RepID=A0AAD4DLU8_9FUNG|nr:hypothetical protein BGZ95_001927 [Linnemannia exigua]
MSVPVLQNACIAPASTGAAVYLAGVSLAGSLSIYSVNLANPNSPTATSVATSVDTAWSLQTKKSCIAFPGLQGTTNPPFLVQQYGVRSSQQLNVYPNGTLWGPYSFTGTAFVSPQLYNYAGASKESVWITAATNNTYNSGGPWIGMRLNATDMFMTLSDPVLTNFPSATALVSVGTYVPTQNTPAQGFSIVFDVLGSGNIFSALDTSVAMNGTDRVITLAAPRPGSDGTAVLYSINPSQNSKLQRVSFPGNAPLFTPGMAATVMGTSIVVYGSDSGSATTNPFNVYDTLAATWSGPGLVKPSPSAVSTSANLIPSPTGSNSASNGETGIAGALVVIALIAFFVIRNRRKSREVVEEEEEETGPDGPIPAYNNTAKPSNNIIVSPTLSPAQAQHQQPGFDPRVSYYSQPPQSPTIFQAQPDLSNNQKPYNYSPPIVNPNAPQPTIFQPASSSPAQSYGQQQAMYSPAHTVVPYSPTTSQTQSNPPGTPHYGGYV